jgi:hypothetical protein
MAGQAADYATTLRAAQLGNVEEMARLPGAATAHLEAYRLAASDKDVYLREVARVTNEMEAIGKLQAAAAERRLNDLEQGMGLAVMQALARAMGLNMGGYAEGGIASGPTSGYPVMLHGTEAIIPLRQGSVPVVVNNDALAAEI